MIAVLANCVLPDVSFQSLESNRSPTHSNSVRHPIHLAVRLERLAVRKVDFFPWRSDAHFLYSVTDTLEKDGDFDVFEFLQGSLHLVDCRGGGEIFLTRFCGLNGCVSTSEIAVHISRIAAMVCNSAMLSLPSGTSDFGGYFLERLINL